MGLAVSDLKIIQVQWYIYQINTIILYTFFMKKIILPKAAKK